eukprot:scaffold27826_cov129-Isochrysis_galbana.AAC.1
MVTSVTRQPSGTSYSSRMRLTSAKKDRGTPHSPWISTMRRRVATFCSSWCMIRCHRGMFTEPEQRRGVRDRTRWPGQTRAAGLAVSGLGLLRATRHTWKAARWKQRADAAAAGERAHRCTRIQSLPAGRCAAKRSAEWCPPSSQCERRRPKSIRGAPHRSTLDPLHRGCLSAPAPMEQAQFLHHTSRHASGARSAKRSRGPAVLGSCASACGVATVLHTIEFPQP